MGQYSNRNPARTKIKPNIEMRPLNDILKELKEHPDCLYAVVFDKDDILGELNEMLYTYADEEVFIEDYDIDDIDIEKEDLTQEDWNYFKDCILGYYEKLYEFMGHYGDYYEDGYIKWLDDMPQDLQKRIKRHIKLKSILKKD
jgi:hypothetical protein